MDLFLIYWYELQIDRFFETAAVQSLGWMQKSFGKHQMDENPLFLSRLIKWREVQMNRWTSVAADSSWKNVSSAGFQLRTEAHVHWVCTPCGVLLIKKEKVKVNASKHCSDVSNMLKWIYKLIITFYAWSVHSASGETEWNVWMFLGLETFNKIN